MALFEHHLAFRRHLRVGQHQMGHPVGFQRHHQFETVLGDVLVVAGVVVRGEGVLLTAVARDQLGELAGGVGGGALEHQVLEQVGDAAATHRIVAAADLVPDHVGDDRHPMVGNHHHLHPVVEGEGLGTEHLGAGRVREDGREQPRDHRKRHPDPWASRPDANHPAAHLHAILVLRSDPAMPINMASPAGGTSGPAEDRRSAPGLRGGFVYLLHTSKVVLYTLFTHPLRLSP